jgi:hypothetical protein
VIRDRNNLYVETVDGDIENIYRLHIVNMDPRPHDFASPSTVSRARSSSATRATSSTAARTSSHAACTRTPRSLEHTERGAGFEIVAEDMPSLRAVHESRFMKPL